MPAIQINDGVPSISLHIVLNSAADVDWLIGALNAAKPIAFPPVETHSVILRAPGEKRINVIKEIREITSLGLKEAKDMTEGDMPKTVATGLTPQQAAKAVSALLNNGADAYSQAVAP